jgi:ribosome biogenesis protein ERB1
MSDDSSDEEVLVRVGDVPLEWYDNMPHAGYNIDGRTVAKLTTGDSLERHIERGADPEWWKTLTDKLNQRRVRMTPEMLELIERLRARQTATKMLDPYKDLDLSIPKDIFATNGDVMPSKRSFQPSKWERLKITRLAKAIEKGWLRPKPAPKEEVWDIWNTEATVEAPAPPKWILPGNEESYNPPEEYLMSPEEQQKWLAQHPEDRDLNFMPQKYDALRKVPSYNESVKERFERCLDLFLAPRVIRPKININPESLIPDLPDPETLRPFPSDWRMDYIGHASQVLAMSFSPSGEWLASCDVSGQLKVWDAYLGKCYITKQYDHAVKSLAWNPVFPLLAIAAGTTIFLESFDLTGLIDLEHVQPPESDLSVWDWEAGRLSVKCTEEVLSVVWHRKGDYFASLSQNQAVSKQVLVHSLSRRTSHKMFSRKSKGQIRAIDFHPTRPLLLVATRKNMMVYNLKEQLLVKKFIGMDSPASLALHPSGDHVLLACEDCKLQWYDYDLSASPYKSFGFHTKALSSVHCHSRYPLFATSSKDRSLHIFHASVSTDLSEAPKILPIKKIPVQGVPRQVQFHPRQPWLAAVVGDKISLFV